MIDLRDRHYSGNRDMTVLDLRWQNDRSWWTVDDDFTIRLTDKAPQEAVESFEHYQEQIKEKTKDPNRHII